MNSSDTPKPDPFSSTGIDLSMALPSLLNTEVRIDDEALFARDFDGHLVRVEKVTAAELDETVTLTIDGTPVTVPVAVPKRDSQGKVLRDNDGTPIPRPTTIYDATSTAFVTRPGQAHPIPTLCHKEHLPPVGVCRVCMVEVTEMTRRGSRSKLVPSCVQRVTDGMIVNTVSSRNDTDAAERVRRAASTIVELLIADHAPSKDAASESAKINNELVDVANRLGVKQSRFEPSKSSRGKDLSSQMIAVNHDECILCSRCIRGCSGIKLNHVIGKSGKGYETQIAFDLNDPMGQSSCVSCGECAVSCPTGALQFQPSFIETQIKRVKDDLLEDGSDGEIVTADDLVQYPLFQGIPYKFLQFNGAAVVRRTLTPGQTLCTEGEYGSTAFVILRGEFEVFLSTARGAVRNRRADGIWGWLGGLKTVVEAVGGRAHLSDLSGVAIDEDQRILVNAEDVILGEMTCLNRYPRSATVVATKPAEVLEIKRNVLYMLQRNEVSREILDHVYRKRSLQNQLMSLPILESLSQEDRKRVAEALRDRVDLISVDPGQVIFRQGDPADNYYVTRLGFVKITQQFKGDERVLNYLAPGNAFGEIGLLGDLGRMFAEELGTDIQPGARTATCTALDHVELIRIRGKHFRELVRKFPTIRASMIQTVGELLKRDVQSRRQLQEVQAEDFLEQGLYLAQSLLVLDLERCTRCDECTKACADTHDGVTRLVRDGLRFDKFLVASSCRSCMDPYCLVGCPVDAIHRNGDSLEIAIEDYCIGCGLCADNCPYGNINMHGFPKQEVDEKGRLQTVYQTRRDGSKKAVVQQRATTCDLCRSIDGTPSCVYACPHDAAFRMTGPELYEITSRQSQTK
ncbi:cyclic nucleotide-binding domain-containing protein [Aporhodopirellula aestuarii]|uniref:Cyclic nucleotide-binding domain-containing protein n=1 Tax=Aporhodopirellula aestuarii TaxID=2950107 RepID=A0ABT0UCU9_9BACT|nr:cyclic nucleotide-binding domain-containing protein [Aporhodopirellula aestuarii]MCM2374627.1 cyclic nucleotide-binding domain-containing protein [Aporhodopirellula aestuarii]